MFSLQIQAINLSSISYTPNGMTISRHPSKKFTSSTKIKGNEAASSISEPEGCHFLSDYNGGLWDSTVEVTIKIQIEIE